MNSYLLHADADSFFASVALRDRPELATKPVAAVAHLFIASANYPAREYGIHAGMLVDEARELCPRILLVESYRQEVEAVGDALYGLFDSVARGIEPGSIEEAFLDVGARTPDAALEVAHELRRRAAAELRIPVSVGIGRTKLMAKLASRAAKPDGVHVIDEGRELELRTELPIGEVWGIGSRTEARLLKLGVARIGDVDVIPRDELLRVCGTGMARRLWRIRAGTDEAMISPIRHRTSLTSESSTSGYARADRTPEEVVEGCVERVCHRATRAGLSATGMKLELRPVGLGAVREKYHGIDSSASFEVWMPVARKLLAASKTSEIESASVTLTGLVPVEMVQPTLF
ncbi:DNA polymerase IV [Pseudoclavibacter helvolus]|uniref:Y-family DNA polymerase n=1 Tax=Pseudoclavibacter helvolus TaxID=255205 RepID=UPI0024AD7F08|nr:DNA polymerase IV [Pseudoclavibacter helvolus]